MPLIYNSKSAKYVGIALSLHLAYTTNAIVISEITKSKSY